jgi:hypothetical protein
MIETAVEAIFDGTPVPQPVSTFKGCGHDCKGNGLGCG